MSRSRLYTWSITLIVIAAMTTFIYRGYTHLKQYEEGVGTDLYTLIPADCNAILETNDINVLSHNIRNARFSEAYKSFHVSDLLSFLTEKLHLLSNQQAHGLSSEMSRLIISFHRPGTPHDQIVYGRMTQYDKKFLTDLLRRNSLRQMSPKRISYKGEEIIIYPLGEDYLACYLQPGFFAISYQAELIKQVIDTHRSGSSISNDKQFAQMRKKRKRSETLSLYIRDAHRPESSNSKPTGWSEYDIRMNNGAVYLSGQTPGGYICHLPGGLLEDSLTVARLDGDELPNDVQLVCQLPFTRQTNVIKRNERPRTSGETLRDSLLAPSNERLLDYLETYMHPEVACVIFTPQTTPDSTAEVLCFALKETQEEAEYALRLLPVRRVATYWCNDTAYPVWRYRAASLLHPYLGHAPKADEYYVAFHAGCFLVGETPESVRDYLTSTTSRQNTTDETGENETDLYSHCFNDLAERANLTLVADMNRIIDHAEADTTTTRLLPPFFYIHKDFFKNFMLSTQFIYTNGNMNTNLILTYQGDSAAISH